MGCNRHGYVATPRPLHPYTPRSQSAVNRRWTCSTTPHSPDQNVLELLTWCQQVGISSPSLTVRTQEGQRGLFATRSIRRGEELFCIPCSTALRVDITSEQPPPMLVFKGLDTSFWNNASWHLRLTVVLLDAYLAGTSSFFHTYINCLPTEPNSVLWAYQRLGRSSVVSQLAPYHMAHSADLYRRSIKSKFTSFQNSLPQHLHHVVSLQMFCWASSNVGSRAFGVPPPSSLSKKPVEFAMFPMLDMANGSVHVPTRIHFDSQNDCIRVVTGASFSPGEQVYVSYGSKSNDDFMFFYGFVEGDNPSNTATITDFREWMLTLAHRETFPIWDRKLAILRRLGLADKDNIFAFYMDKLDDRLMAALRITLATAHQLDAFEKAKRESKKFPTIDLENELKAWDAIFEKCQSLLAELPQFTKEDEQRLNEILRRRPCTAGWDFGKTRSDGELLFGHERARVLRATLERVSHFSKVSQSVGRICTVLMPPSQQLLRADLFQLESEGFGAVK